MLELTLIVGGYVQKRVSSPFFFACISTRNFGWLTRTEIIRYGSAVHEVSDCGSNIVIH